DAGEVKVIVQAVAKEYEEKVARKEKADRVRRFEGVKKIHDEALGKFKESREELAKMADALGTSETPALPQKQLNLLTTLGEVKKNHAIAENLRMNLEAQLARLQAQNKLVQEQPVSDSFLEQTLANDPVARTHLTRIAELEKVINAYAKGE